MQLIHITYLETATYSFYLAPERRIAVIKETCWSGKWSSLRLHGVLSDGSQQTAFMHFKGYAGISIWYI